MYNFFAKVLSNYENLDIFDVILFLQNYDELFTLQYLSTLGKSFINLLMVVNDRNIFDSYKSLYIYPRFNI